MMRRRPFLIRLICTGTAGTLSGCGTILHPERVQSHHSRDLDWKVVALDGLGLMLFFIPGVVAFVVDFYTGAIYLPPQAASSYRPPVPPPQPTLSNAESIEDERLQKVAVPREQLDRGGIERTVSEHIGQDVSLEDPLARVSPLEELDEYDSEIRRHREDKTYGLAVLDFFRSIGKRS